MENFEAYNPTRLLVGKEMWGRLPELLEQNNAKNILLAYGGGSIKRIGLFDTLMEQMKGFNVIEFGGIEANPDFDTLIKAVDLARENNVDFILAVGGGSVIDGVKFISGAIPYNGDPWDVLDRKEGCVFDKAIPFGTVLTLPATGSEANSGAVISRRSMEQKRVMGGPLFFPKFSFCNPELVASLPKRQIANGIIDAYMHTLEQYLTYPSGNHLQERHAESIMQTLIEIKDVVNDPGNYELASNLMWCATHALNGNLRAGVPTDWTTHMIGHELTAFFGIDHARTLAIVAPRLFEHQMNGKMEKLVQYAERVWGLKGSDTEKAQGAIQQTEHFFNSLGVDTRLSGYTEDTEGTAERIRAIFEDRNWIAMGERQAIEPQHIEEIVKATY